MTVRKKGTQRRGERGTIAVRGYGLTSWSRAFVDVVEGRGADGESVADSRRITKARRYFRDRHLRGLRIGAGRVTASVEGTQLEPFERHPDHPHRRHTDTREPSPRAQRCR